MIQNNPLDDALVTPVAQENGDHDVNQLRRERDILRQSLMKAETERDQMLRLFYAYVRDHVTAEEKAETEVWARAMLSGGGRPASELLELIESLRSA